MKKHLSIMRTRSRAGFTLIETLIASSAFAMVMGSIMVGFVMFSRTYQLATDYAMARLTLSDYLNMDFRRSTDFFPTILKDVTRGGWLVDEWTLPAVVFAPNYISTGGTQNPPVRVTLSAADWEAAKDAAIARGKMPPPSWGVGYGSASTGRMIVYEQADGIIVRREGWGSATRPTATTVSWTWTGGTPIPVQVAKGVIQVKGVFKATTDLTPLDLTEQPPDDVVTTFKANYTIRYVPSNYSKYAPQMNSTIFNNVLLRAQFFGL
jgi:Tfp pilus assembly protein PilV